VKGQVADDNHWKLGTVLDVKFPSGSVQRLPIVAIFDANTFVGDYLLSIGTFEQRFTQQLDQQVLIRSAPGADPEAVRGGLDKALRQFPNVDVQDQTEFRQQQEQQIDTLLGLITALLLLAIIIALVGIVNTLALSIFERTREIGLLRAVGMSRRQVRGMIRWEAVVIAVFGAVLGVALGIFFGWALVEALKDQGISVFAIPVGQLVIYILLAGLAGILAAVWPARRAAKLDVLRAVTIE
jgi:putative ABC transport system permease protein